MAARQPRYRTTHWDQALIFQMVGYEPHTPEVVRFHQSQAKIKIVCSPARTSKSYAGAHDALVDCFPPLVTEVRTGETWPTESRRIWIVAPKYQLAKEFEYLWDILVDRRSVNGLTFYTLGKCHNSPDQGHMTITLEWGKDMRGIPQRTIIEVRSAAHMQSIQADQADVVLMSEAADQPSEVWEKYVSTRYGRAILPTTPKIQADWLRILMDYADSDPALSIETFQFNGTANPFYDWSRYWREHSMAESRASAPPDAKLDLGTVDQSKPPSPQRSSTVRDPNTGRLASRKPNGHDCFYIGDQCWASRDPHFAEQFMGRWTQVEGKIFPFRVRPHFPGQSVHVIERLPAWVKDNATYYLSVDHGFDDPSAVPWFAVSNDGTVILFDLIYERGQTPNDLARLVARRQADRGYWLGKHGFPSPPKLAWAAGDPQNPNVRAEFRRVGLPLLAIEPKRQRDRRAGRLIIQDYLSDDPLTGRPKFYVHTSCTAAIDELRLLRRKPNTPGEEKYVGADHAVDAIRYFLTALPHGGRREPTMRRDPDIYRAQQLGLSNYLRAQYNPLARY